MVDSVDSVDSVEVERLGPWTVHPEVVINTQQRLCDGRASGGQLPDDARAICSARTRGKLLVRSGWV